MITDDLECVIDESDVLVVTHSYDELYRFQDKLSKKSIIDLVRMKDSLLHGDYEGICW
jgi:hypothetical protein